MRAEDKIIISNGDVGYGNNNSIKSYMEKRIYKIHNLLIKYQTMGLKTTTTTVLCWRPRRSIVNVAPFYA